MAKKQKSPEETKNGGQGDDWFFAEEKPTVPLPTIPTIRLSRCAAGKKP